MNDIDAYMALLQHPHKEAVAQLRALILSADASIGEGVKWNAPSFHVGGYFATVHLKAKIGVALIFHLGAQGRDLPQADIEDPAGLLTWLGKDRAIVHFANLAEVDARAAALQALVRRWIQGI